MGDGEGVGHQLTELHLLTGHKDIVRVLTRIDDRRYGVPLPYKAYAATSANASSAHALRCAIGSHRRETTRGSTSGTR